jgi:hypothetical protein
MPQHSPKTIANVRVGKPDVEPTTPSHVRGVREGNSIYPSERERELASFKAGDAASRRQSAVAGARRSTGINDRAKNPIDPRMPKLSPS